MGKKLSVCLITLNEENNLASCLDSVKDIADEIVIADSGSTDDTKEIAEEYGANFFSFEWRDDFSYARNLSIQQAIGDWVMVIDPDEKLFEEDQGLITEIVKENKDQLVFFRLIDAYSGDSHVSPKLWKNNNKIMFESVIHEQAEIMPGSEGDIETVFSDIRYMHYGYRTDLIESKNTRNFRLVRAAYDSDQNNPKLAYYLAKEYDAAGRSAEAIKYYEKAIDGPNFNFLPAALRNLVDIYEKLGQFDKAEALTVKGVAVFSDFTDLRYLLGLIYLRTGKVDQAIAAFSECLEVGEETNLYPHIKGTGSFLAYRGLGFCAQRLGDYQRAVGYFAKAIAGDRSDEVSKERVRSILKDDLRMSGESVDKYLKEIYEKSRESR